MRFLTKMTSFDRFRSLLSQNCHKKVVHIDELDLLKKIFCCTMSILDLWRHFWSEKTSFLRFLTKNDQVWKFWMPFKPKLSWKKLFSLTSLTFWKKIFCHTMSFLKYDVTFGPKRRLFSVFWQKWPVWPFWMPFKTKLS